MGRPGSGALPPPTARPLGGLPGPTTHWLWVRGGAGVGTCHQPHSARSCELALRAVGAARGRPGGGRLLPGCGASGVGRSPCPDCPPSGRGAGAHYPLAVDAGGCGRGNLSQTPQRALLRAGFARCGGGTRVPGGALLAWVWGVRVRALSHPRLPAPWAGCRGPLPTGCGCGGMRAWGLVTNPTARAPASWFCALWGRHEGARGGGASCLGVARPGSGALPPPTARPLGGLPGPTTHWLWVPGGAGVGTRHKPHSALSCELALHAVGAARGCPGGAPLAWVWGVRGRALSQPRLPALWPGCRGPLPTCCGCGGLRAWGPVTNPTARALSSSLCALWGRHEGARGGAPLAWVRGVRGRVLSHPRLPALWAGCRGPLPTACGCGGMRAWGPVTNPTASALASWLCALWGRHEGARGGASCLGVGRTGLGAFPPPTARPLGGLPGPNTHWLWVPGGAGVGTRHKPHSSRSCELALHAVGAARGCPGGRLLPGCGASGLGRSPTPDCPPSGRAAGAHYPLAVGAGGRGRGDPSPTPQRALLRAVFARCGGGMRAPGGGHLLPGCGASGVGRSPTPDCPPSGRAAGAHYPLAEGAGGCGRGDPSPTPQGALLRAGFARCGGGMRVPGGAPLAWVWGVWGRALSHP